MNPPPVILRGGVAAVDEGSTTAEELAVSGAGLVVEPGRPAALLEASERLDAPSLRRPLKLTDDGWVAGGPLSRTMHGMQHDDDGWVAEAVLAEVADLRIIQDRIGRRLSGTGTVEDVARRDDSAHGGAVNRRARAGNVVCPVENPESRPPSPATSRSRLRCVLYTGPHTTALAW